MAIAPRVKGDTGPQFWTIQDTGGNALPITGATFIFWIYNPKTNQMTQGAGTFTITGGAAGKVTYATAPGDVAVPEKYQCLVQINLTDGTVRFTAPQDFTVTPLFKQQ